MALKKLSEHVTHVVYSLLKVLEKTTSNTVNELLKNNKKPCL